MIKSSYSYGTTITTTGGGYPSKHPSRVCHRRSLAPDTLHHQVMSVIIRVHIITALDIVLRVITEYRLSEPHRLT